MRHVDDGTLHAWLDGEVTDAAVAAWVDEHLRDCPDCAARLADARSTLEQADALLALAAPAVDRPPFDRLAQRAEGPAADDRRARPRWLMPASWAASVVLAAAIGWAARDAALPDRSRPDAVSLVSREPVTPNLGAPAPPSREEPASTETTAAVRPQELSRRAEAARESLEDRLASLSAARPPAAADAAADAPTPQADGGGARRTAIEAGGARLPSESTAARALVSPGAESARAGVPAPPALPPAEPTAPAFPRTAALTPPAIPQSAGAIESGAETRAAAASAPVSGTTTALAETITIPAWRPVSRTEAAALTRMPLYGIEGLTPALTALDPLGVAVRTVYQLPSGGSVELLQRRLRDEGAINVLTTQRAFVPQGARAQARRVPDVPAWSDVRGDVRLTLRALSEAPDLTTLGTRLRLD